MVFTLFCLPETLFFRRTITGRRERAFRDLLLFRQSGSQERKLRAIDFLRPFYMLKYLSIVIPGLYYMTAFGFGWLCLPQQVLAFSENFIILMSHRLGCCSVYHYSSDASSVK